MAKPAVTDISDILITGQLQSRTMRLPNLMAENMMMSSLAQELSHGSQSFLNNAALTARHLCRAGAAGIALLQKGVNGDYLRWPAVVGEFSSSEGKLSTFHHNPVSYTIRMGRPQLFSYPGRYYSYLHHLGPEIVEALGIPILSHQQGECVGVIWVTSHDPEQWFDGEDLRVLEALARYVAAFLDVFEDQERAHQIAIEESKRRQKMELVQKELKSAVENAERANLTKSFFLANMSHEIRTPLGIILGFSELLKDQTMQAKEREQFLKSIERNGKILTKLIDDILDLSKVESGKVQIEAIEFSLTDLVQEVAGLFSEKVKSKGLLLTVDQDVDVPEYVCSDPTRLRQILINVVGNAIKFTSRGGVLIHVTSRPCKISGEHDLFIRVKDTGEGIPLGQQGHLFEPFMQADPSTTRRFGGTGLGLVLSHRFAQALGGGVSIESSEPGAGTTLLIRVQVKEADPERTDCHQRIEIKFPRECLMGSQILVVDDTPDNVFLASTLLRRHGATVFSASSGHEALGQITQRDFDLILMDIQMPQMDGFETFQRIRGTGYSKPVIALTAHAMTEERKKCLEAGFCFHLSKPFEFDELIETVLKCLNGDLSCKELNHTAQNEPAALESAEHLVH